MAQSVSGVIIDRGFPFSEVNTLKEIASFWALWSIKTVPGQEVSTQHRVCHIIKSILLGFDPKKDDPHRFAYGVQDAEMDLLFGEIAHTGRFPVGMAEHIRNNIPALLETIILAALKVTDSDLEVNRALCVRVVSF